MISTEFQRDVALNAEQAARLIGFSRRAFDYWLAGASPPPSFMIGKRRFYWKSQIKAWNQQQRGQALHEPD